MLSCLLVCCSDVSSSCSLSWPEAIQRINRYCYLCKYAVMLMTVIGSFLRLSVVLKGQIAFLRTNCSQSNYIFCIYVISVPSVHWHCWLGVRKSIRPVKNWVMRCWCGYLSGARCRLFAYGPADATASQNPIISCLIKSRLVLHL